MDTDDVRVNDRKQMGLVHVGLRGKQAQTYTGRTGDIKGGRREQIAFRLIMEPGMCDRMAYRFLQTRTRDEKKRK